MNKASENKTATVGQHTAQKKKKVNVLTTFICIFLGVAIIFGAALGIMIAVREARAVAKYSGVTMDGGVANFFASRYKIEYIGALRDEGIMAYDTEQFFESLAEDGKSYGEHFLEGFKDYIRRIIVANKIYSKYSSLDAADRSCIEASVEAAVKYRAGGSVDKFNEIASKYGFDYDDFLAATEMLYKAEYAQLILYGMGGENLKNYSELTEEYLATYSHVSLAFVSTDTYIYTDPDTGLSERLPLTADKKAEREEHIASVTELINNKKSNNGAPVITEQTIKDLQNKYDSDKDMNATGYYFNPSAEKTAEFRVKFSSVVEKSYEMKPGEYDVVELAVPSDDGDGYDFVGVCFIYKSECASGAYRNTDNVFFSDFYQNASNYFYSEAIEELACEVVFTPLYDELIRPLSVPQNYELFITGWVSGS
ncbi:MAG: hypothetical protein J6Q85_00140 [Clostridia bacterium]|nr:hypothetical protein [Clostridia bacterium]